MPPTPTELPEPPWRVLAKCWGRHGEGPLWWIWHDGAFIRFGDDLGRTTPKRLTLVDHPANDPEAVALITAAKDSHGN